MSDSKRMGADVNSDGAICEFMNQCVSQLFIVSTLQMHSQHSGNCCGGFNKSLVCSIWKQLAYSETAADSVQRLPLVQMCITWRRYLPRSLPAAKRQ